jgi:hypothetical protein
MHPLPAVFAKLVPACIDTQHAAALLSQALLHSWPIFQLSQVLHLPLVKLPVNHLPFTPHPQLLLLLLRWSCRCLLTC